MGFFGPSACCDVGSDDSDKLFFFCKWSGADAYELIATKYVVTAEIGSDLH